MQKMAEKLQAIENRKFDTSGLVVFQAGVFVNVFRRCFGADKQVILNVRTLRCPTCRKLAPWEENAFRPFCSKRCRTVDLGAWLDERYRIPGDPVLPGDLDDEETD